MVFGDKAVQLVEQNLDVLSRVTNALVEQLEVPENISNPKFLLEVHDTLTRNSTAILESVRKLAITDNKLFSNGVLTNTSIVTVSDGVIGEIDQASVNNSKFGSDNAVVEATPSTEVTSETKEGKKVS